MKFFDFLRTQFNNWKQITGKLEYSELELFDDESLYFLVDLSGFQRVRNSPHTQMNLILVVLLHKFFITKNSLLDFDEKSKSFFV